MRIRRRRFLQWLAALQSTATFPMLPGCSADERRTVTIPDGAPFSLWRRMREAVRRSPDHLAHRARELTASGDIAAIFAFVRDAIVLRPFASPTFPVQVQNAGHAGIRGVLRSGIATPREKAELLKVMLTEAGYETTIVDGDIEFESRGGTALFSRGAMPPFAPDSSIAPVARWLEALGIDNDAGPRPTELDQTLLDTLSARMLAAIPAADRGAPTDWAACTAWLPLVRIEREGEAVYANPNVREAVLGEHYCTNAPRPSPLQDPVATPRLRLSVTMTGRQAPAAPEKILEGEWAIGELIGRRVQLRFQPTQTANELLALPVSQLRSFRPVFMVAGADLTENDAARLGVGGDVITTDAERISAGDGAVVVDGKVLSLGDADPALAATVTEIDMAINASEYPRIRMEAGLRQADGTPVHGLPLSVFALQQGDRPAAPRLRANLPAAPRIAFALDFSTSLDERFRGARLADIVERIGEALAARRPEIEFRAGAFSGAPIGSAVSYFGGWSGDIAATAAAIRREAPTAPQTSTYFQALADATNGEASLVVLITDADGADTDRPDIAALISEGCPAVVIAVRSALTQDAHFARLAELSGGHLFPVEDLEAAVRSIVDLVESQTERPYVLDFVADGADRTETRVRLSLPASMAFAEATYDRPEASVPQARAITGLFLTIELGNRRVTRRLAGYPLVGEALLPLTDAHLDAARLGLLGRYELSVEASAPTAAAALDDVLSTFLSCEALVTAAASRNQSEIVTATEQGFDDMPYGWLALNSPLPQSPGSTSFQAGYRLVLFSDLPDTAGHFRRKVDILPFTDWRTITSEREDAFAANLRHTLQLSLLEAENYSGSSTIANVGDSDYLLRPAFQFSNWAFRIDDAELQRAWRIAVADRGSPRLTHQLLLPATTTATGYWEVDTNTGGVLGLLPDASGGATVEDTTRRFELLAQVIDVYTELMQSLMAAPPGFHVWVELEKAKLEHLKRATIAIILMDGTNTSGYGDLLADQLQDWITDRIQSTVDDSLGEMITGYSELQEAVGWHSQAQQLWEAASR